MVLLVRSPDSTYRKLAARDFLSFRDLHLLHDCRLLRIQFDDAAGGDQLTTDGAASGIAAGDEEGGNQGNQHQCHCGINPE